MADHLPSPLGGPPPAEVPLPKAPLARVLAQVTFPGVLKIDNKNLVSTFQDEIKKSYPLFERQAGQQINVQIGGAPIVQQLAGTVWIFSDIKSEWRVALNTTSLSLDTSNYVSRADFLARWAPLLSAVRKIFEPQIAQRIGMRYIDRIVENDVHEIEELVRPGILGMAISDFRQYASSSLTETIFRVAEGEMLLRWGTLPPNTTIHPGLLTPVPNTSWILDIDVYSQTQRVFDETILENEFKLLAERIYTVFRHMTTDKFLKKFGGKT